MKLRYLNAQQTMVEALLDPGEAFLTFSNPPDGLGARAYPIVLDDGTQDGRKLVEGINAGTYPLPDPFVGGTLVDAVAALDSISDRQFWQQLALDKVITQAEALTAVKTGDIPKKLDDIISASFTPDEQFGIRMKVSGATTFRLADPATQALSGLLGYDTAKMRDLWSRASTL